MAPEREHSSGRSGRGNLAWAMAKLRKLGVGMPPCVNDGDPLKDYTVAEPTPGAAAWRMYMIAFAKRCFSSTKNHVFCAVQDTVRFIQNGDRSD